MNPLAPQIRKLHLIQIVAALLGTALSIYLLVHHTRVKLGIQDSSSFCSFGGLADCDVVNVSKYSEVAGVPLAAIGAIYFFVLLILGILIPPRNPNFQLVNRFLAWLSLIALLIDLFLLVGVQWLMLKSFCLMCILTYLANLAHLGANFRQTQLQYKSHLLQNLFWGNRPWSLRQFSSSRFVMALISIIAFSGLLLFLPSWIELKNGQAGQEKEAASDFLSQWSQLPVQEVSIGPEDSTSGNPEAKVKIVVFSDFQCPFCKKTAFSLHTLLPSFKNEIWVAFKNFPLDPTCNSLVQHKMHPYACSLARLSVCANKKGKFWEYHDQVFMHIDEGDLEGGWDVIRKKLASVFTGAEIDECLRSPESLSPVQKDIDLGIQLGIQGTPAVFINGRLVSVPLDMDTLRKIISLENHQK